MNIFIDYDRSVGNEYYPGGLMWLGNGWQTKTTGQTAKYLFLKNVHGQERPFDWDEMEGVMNLSERIWNSNMYFMGAGHVLIEDCKFQGERTTPTGYCNRYVMYRNNDVNTLAGNTYFHAINTVFENNSIVRAPWEIGTDVTIGRRGLYLRGNSYVAHNIAFFPSNEQWKKIMTSF